MRSVSTRKPLPAAARSDEELRLALKGLQKILNVIELDEQVGRTDQGGVDLVGYARQMISERSRRYHYFNAHLFSDPAWDIMLELFVAELEKRDVPVTTLCFTSNVPDTTVLRWIKTLAFEGLVVRRKDKVDKRRVLVQLSRPAAEAMQRYIEEQMRGAENKRAATAAGEDDGGPAFPAIADRSN